MLKQLGFVLDVNRCLGCGACAKACRLGNSLPAEIVFRKLRRVELKKRDGLSRFYLSTACNHCQNPECLRVCPSGTYAKRRDGIVMHNQDKCTGCKSCLSSCPFEAPQFNALASKCQLCYPRLENNKLPYCVQACVTGALQLKEIQNIALDELVRLTAPLRSLRLTKPSVFYYPPRTTAIK